SRRAGQLPPAGTGVNSRALRISSFELDSFVLVAVASMTSTFSRTSRLPPSFAAPRDFATALDLAMPPGVAVPAGHLVSSAIYHVPNAASPSIAAHAARRFAARADAGDRGRARAGGDRAAPARPALRAARPRRR